METWLMLLSVPFLLFVLLMILFTIGCWLPERRKVEDTPIPVTVAIIIPFRNEAGNLKDCLMSLSRQDYPRDLTEIICVDDESDDSGASVIQEFIQDHPEMRISLSLHCRRSSQMAYKKSCIRQGIDVTSGELIVTLDADVVVGQGWLSSLVETYKQRQVSMVIGPAAFSGDKTVFGRFQQLEFAGLIGSTAGAAAVGLPFMCNGANLAYARQAFYAVKGFDHAGSMASGDDVFLLLKMKKRLGSRSIAFVRNQQAVAWTKPASTLRDFIHQRIRWISKTKGYRDTWILAVEVIVYLAHLYWPTMVILAFWIPDAIWLAVLYPVVKSLVELPLILSITFITHQNNLLWWLFPFQLLYPFYVIMIGVAGLFARFEWKGRTYR